MTDAPVQTHTPAEAQSELSARLAAVNAHLATQMQHNAPITPWVTAELADIARSIAGYEPPPDPPPPAVDDPPSEMHGRKGRHG